ncbi:hypothetical protein COCCADRAFT_10540 [Bipolaris zeicola 26-R-13]|uniref:Uncharacterized protein n=1 Tax=Cochliobolus carbonum (strain 26-R-13) TaxID=930089 RepID=W6XM68_COCC2|nr:uncharacterized protein COCCADRAFT_10540 [Bipolaris zeicola 26-R-13]EUC26658.1 hypothetical protein COCCADRAFT_10540 [Bipolaris zeicola 26-R-13]
MKKKRMSFDKHDNTAKQQAHDNECFLRTIQMPKQGKLCSNWISFIARIDNPKGFQDSRLCIEYPSFGTKICLCK